MSTPYAFGFQKFSCPARAKGDQLLKPALLLAEAAVPPLGIIPLHLLRRISRLQYGSKNGSKRETFNLSLARLTLNFGVVAVSFYPHPWLPS